MEDSPVAIQEFFDSGGDTNHSDYLNLEEKSLRIEEEFTLSKLQNVFFSKMKGLSAPGIGDFTSIG